MIQFDFEILWMSSQLIVLWNYIIYFHIRDSFFNNFLQQFWNRLHNLKEIIDIQGLFVLNVSYIGMTIYLVIKYYYIIERGYFIYRLIILFISTLSFLLFLYTVSQRYMRDYLHAIINIWFYIMFYIINTMKNLHSFIPGSYLRYKKGPGLNLASQSTICSYTPSVFIYKYIAYLR